MQITAGCRLTYEQLAGKGTDAAHQVYAGARPAKRALILTSLTGGDFWRTEQPPHLLLKILVSLAAFYVL